MQSSVIRSPRKAVELFRLLPEGVLCEVIDNTIYMSPGTSYTHQKIKQTILVKMVNYLKKSR